MTLVTTGSNTSNISQLGEGTLEYRLKIDGFEYEFVTSKEMEKVDGDIERVNGLKTQGLRIDQEIIIPEGVVESQPLTFQVVETSKEILAKKVIRRRVRKRSHLTHNVTPDTTSFFVDSTTGWEAGDLFWIGSECCKIGSVVGGSEFRSITRGYLNTVAQSHFVESAYGRPRRPPITDIPGLSITQLSDRGASLFAYDQNADLQGDGEQIWRGKVTGAPGFSDFTLAIPCEGAWDAITGQIGNSVEKYNIRGYYFSLRPWEIRIELYDTDDWAGNVIDSANVVIRGLFENKWQVADEMNRQLSLITDIFQTTDSDAPYMGAAVVENEIIIWWHFTSSQTSPKAIQATTIDGFFDENKFTSRGQANKSKLDGHGHLVFRSSKIIDELFFEDLFWWEITNVQSNEGSFAIGQNTTFGDKKIDANAGNSYAFRLRARPSPDAITTVYGALEPVDYAESRSTPPGRIHLNADRLPTVNQDWRAYLSEDDTLVNSLSERGSLSVLTAQRAIEAYWAVGAQTIIDDTIYWAPGVTLLQDGNIADLVNALINDSPTFVNQGWGPIISDKDWDLSSFQTMVSQSIDVQFLQHRKWVKFGEAEDFKDYIIPDVQLHGACLRYETDGRIGIIKPRHISKREEVDWSIGPEDIIVERGFESISFNDQGRWDSIKLQTGYNGVSGKWEGASYEAINQSAKNSIGGNETNLIEIKPRSEALLGLEDSENVAEALMINITDLVGFTYTTVTIELSLRQFRIQPGDSVSITSPTLASFSTSDDSSVYGVNGELVGLVIGKSFDIENGTMFIKVLTQNAPLYETVDVHPGGLIAPAGTVSSVSAIDEDHWQWQVEADVTAFDTSDLGYLGASQTLSDFIQTGDLLQLNTFDSYNPTISTAMVESATGNSFNVQFIDEPPQDLLSGSATYEFSYAGGDKDGRSSNQQDYAVVSSGSTSGSFNNADLEIELPDLSGVTFNFGF